MLHDVRKSLEKYGHVNKKAFEQYNNFTKQRDTLEQRKSELDNAAKVRHLKDVSSHLS